MSSLLWKTGFALKEGIFSLFFFIVKKYVKNLARQEVKNPLKSPWAFSLIDFFESCGINLTKDILACKYPLANTIEWTVVISKKKKRHHLHDVDVVVQAVWSLHASKDCHKQIEFSQNEKSASNYI